MAKRVVKIQIEIDMDSKAAQKVKNPEVFFNREITSVMNEFEDLLTTSFHAMKERAANGRTISNGSQYHISIKRSKKPIKIFFNPIG